MQLQSNAVPKRIELQRRDLLHFEDLFKSFHYLILTVVRYMKKLSIWIGRLTQTQFLGEESDYEVKNGEIARDRTPRGPESAFLLFFGFFGPYLGCTSIIACNINLFFGEMMPWHCYCL